MNPQTISFIALACAALAIVATIVCIVFTLRARREAERTVALALTWESEINALSTDLDTLTQRVTDQARRIAWLETRVRSGNSSRAEQAPEETIAEPSAPAKTGITERRHRILKLARLGQDAKAIAAMLNVPHGEVELIINLNGNAA